jgi:hypothetical protein
LQAAKELEKPSVSATRPTPAMASSNMVKVARAHLPAIAQTIGLAAVARRLRYPTSYQGVRLWPGRVDLGRPRRQLGRKRTRRVRRVAQAQALGKDKSARTILRLRLCPVNGRCRARPRRQRLRCPARHSRRIIAAVRKSWARIFGRISCLPGVHDVSLIQRGHLEENVRQLFCRQFLARPDLCAVAPAPSRHKGCLPGCYFAHGRSTRPPLAVIC